ncbi:MAG: hypothetical protein IJT94_13670 [Oscillibacter sp.]|nr:hypothetical protein [Oscillibacter sp.]
MAAGCLLDAEPLQAAEPARAGTARVAAAVPAEQETAVRAVREAVLAEVRCF